MNNSRTETGFTLVEVMVAIIILLIGVLGSVKLVDQAQQATTATKAREGATNIARQLVDNARNMPYDKLRGTIDGPTTSVPSGPLTPTYQALPGLADAVTGASSPSWQLVRRGITFTVEASACIIDDPKDGLRGDDSLTGLCPSSLQPAAAVSPATDNNPDDFRRVQVEVYWDVRGVRHNCSLNPMPTGTTPPPSPSGTACVSQTGLIPNPQLGPRVQNVVTTPPSPIVGNETTVHFAVTTTPADSLNWSIDDGHSSGQGGGSNGGTTWDFDWVTDSSGLDCTSSLVDGTYTLSLQAIKNALPGNLFAQQVTLNRCLPRAPTSLIGGRNTRIGTSGGASANGIEDLQWTSNSERDIVGYRVYQVVGTPDTSIGTGAGDDRLVGTFSNSVTGNTYPGCGPQVDGTASLFCFDPQPPAASASQPSYYVVAMDRPTAAAAANNSTDNQDCPAYLNSTALPNGTKFSLAIDKSSGDPATYDRYGCPSAILGPGSIGESTAQPGFGGGNPALGTQPSSDSQLITWNANQANPGTGTIRFFRIYLDGTDYTNRIGRTSSGTDSSFVDQNAGNYTSGTHHYWITAVDSAFQESAPQPSGGVSFTVP